MRDVSASGTAIRSSSVEPFLDALQRGPAALLIDGAVGAGKTTLWSRVVARASARGYRVLACHPAESEASLAFAALGDLLAGRVDESQVELPEPQKRALRVALLMEDPGGSPADQRSVSVATLALLRGLAGRSPVLIAVDDYQWVDGATASVLDFVLRRLRTEPVGILAALRAEAGHRVPTLLAPDLSPREPYRITPEPLAVADLDALFRTRLETSFAPPVLREIAAASAGNPLFALEIARAIHRGEVRAEPGEPLPVPRTLQEFVQERVAELPVEVRELLFMAAAAAEPTLDLLARVAPVDDVERSLGYAVDVGVARIDRRALHFVHPLFASTLYHAVPPRRRRALHRRLVEVVRTPDERARHLSLGTEGADATVAAELDDAARGAAARGAPVVAAELSEQAHRLTPAGEAAARIRRSVNAAEYHFASGATERARELLESVVTSLHGGPERADVLRRLAKVRYRNDSCSVAAELLTRALVEAGGSVPLRAGIERDLAWAVALCGDVRDAAVHARAALERVSGERDGDLLPELLAATTMLDFMLGRGAAWEALERATALERPRAEVPIEWRPGMMLGMTLKWSGEVDGAQERFEALRSRTVETGDETSLPFLLSQMSETATWAGDWSRALRLAEEAHVTALQTRQEPIRAGALYAMALAQAHLGLTQEARASADAGLSLSKRVGSVFAMMLNQSVLGFVELSLGDPAAAHDQLGPLVAWLDVVGIREPGVIRFVPDEVESLIALGELDRADRLLKPYEDDAARLDRPWATLAAARSRALLVATTGDVPAGAALLEQALSAPLARQQPFDYGRALLVLATIQRRTRQRKSTRASADAALEIFDRLGARLWSDKARRILGPSASDPARDATATLTPAERRVAELVAAGASNREVADRLFLSVRGVEVHLTSIYRKLRISSRTQLALRLSGAGVAPVEVGGEDVVG